MEDVILEEINVKAIEFVTDESGLVKKKAKANFKSIGPKFGKSVKQIAERTGGRVLSPSDIDLFHPSRSTRESSRPVFDWFLIALACLIPLDVGLRILLKTFELDA